MPNGYYPKNSVIAHINEQKGKHYLNNSNYSIVTSSGETITPSNELFKYIQDYFSNNYTLGKETVNLLINDNLLEHFHNHLSNVIKNAKRPSNIGIGIWRKQVEKDLKWADDVFGKSSAFAKIFKSIPVITIGIDTVLGVKENLDNNSGLGETISDAIIDIGFGTVESTTSYLVANPVGGIPGLIISFVVGLGVNFLLNSKDSGNKKSIREVVDSIFE